MPSPESSLPSPLDFETTVKAVAEFMSFRRIHGESIDAALARWDILKIRAEGNGLGMNQVTATWMLLTGL